MGLNRMSGKPDGRIPVGRVSQETISKTCGVNVVRVNQILNGKGKFKQEMIDKVLKTASDLGYEKTHNLTQHHKSTLTQDKADKIVEGVILNKTLETIAKETGFIESTVFKYVRGVKVPHDYPETEEEWRKDVVGFMEVAIWKGTKRLAESSMEFIDDRTLPVAIGITLDKLSTLKGQPNSIHLSMTASVNHRDLMADLRDRNTITVNDEQTPDVV